MSKITILLMFVIIALTTNAQINYQWHKKIGATGKNDLVHNVTTDVAGNVYVCGRHGAAVTNDFTIPYSATTSNGFNAFIAKFDPLGNLIWVKNMPINGDGEVQITGLAIGNDGRVFFSGRQTSGNGDIDPGPGVVTSFGSWGILGCLDKDGNFLWGGSLQNIPFIPRVQIQANGDPVFACSFYNNSGTIDLDYGPANVGLSVSNTGVRYGVILLKYSAAGAYQSYMWPTNSPPQLTPLIKGLPTNYSEDAIVSDFEIDNAGNYIVCLNMPWYSGSVIYGKEIILLRWDNNGVYQSHAAITNTVITSFNIENIEVDNTGNIYGVGTMVGSMDFDPGAGTATLNACLATTTAGFVWKVDGSFNYLNAVKIQNNTPCASITAGERSNAYDVSLNGNDVYVVGNWIGTIDFDPGAGVQNVVSAGYDQFLLKLDNNLAYQAVHTFGGASSAGVEYARAVAVNQSKEIIVGSMYDDNITDLDPQSGTVGVTLIGAQDGLVTKFYECGVDPVIITHPSNQTVCIGGSVTFSVAASGTATTYQWKKDGVDIPGATSNTYTINNVSAADVANYTVVVGNLCNLVSVTSDPATLVVNETPSPTGSATQSFCNSGTVANLVATGTSVQWYSAVTGGSPLAGSTTLVNGNTYYASQTLNGCPSLVRLAVVVTIISSPAPGGSASQTLCSGDNLADVVVTGTNIQWYAAASGGSPLPLSTTLVHNTSYYATQTVDGCESPRKQVLVTLTTTAAPTGSAIQNFCGSATVANLVATGTNIQWYTSSTGGTLIPGTTAVVSGTSYYASQTTASGCESTNRLAVTANIFSCENALHFDGANDQVALPSTINSSIASSGTLEAWIKTPNAGFGFRALIVRPNYYGLFLNGNQLMSYNWSVNGSTGPTTYTGAALNDNQWHHVALTFQEGVPNGSQLYLDGQPVGSPFTHFISYVPANFALGANTNTQYYAGLMDRVKIWGRVLTPQELYDSYNCISVTATNLITNYNFNQGFPAQNNAGVSTLTDQALPTADNGTLSGFGLNGPTTNWVEGYACTPNLCATPTGPSSQTFCNSATVSDLVANGTNIQWYSTSTGGSPLNGTTALVTGSIYYATQTTSCESANRLAVTVTINSVAAPTGSVTQSFCNSATVANLSATGTNIQWFTNPTGGTALSSGTALVNGTTYYASQTISGCSSEGRLAVTVTVVSTVTPAGSATQSFCYSATVSDLVATGSNILWYSTSTGGTALSAGTALVNNTTYYASENIGSCSSTIRLAVTVTITSPVTPTGSANQSFCYSASVSNLTATGTNIQWYTTSSGGSALAAGTALVNGTTYYASQTINGCESTNRLAVTVTITSPAAPTGNATQEICTGGNTITVNSLSATGSSIKWYANPSGGTFLASNTPVTNGSTYYATQTINGCESIDRLAVTVILHNFTTNVTAPNPQSFCAGATIADLVANITPGAQLNWYTSSMGWSFGTPLPTNTVLTNGTIYYAGQSLGSTNQCVYAGSFGVTVTLNSTAAPTGSASQTFCNSATVANLTATGTAIQWYTTSTGGTALSAGTTLTNGTTYYASQTVSGCEGINRLAVTVTINAPSVPTGMATQTFCSGATVGSLSATGSNIQWYAAASGGSPLSPSSLLSDGTIYYASQTVNGCENIGRFAVTAVFGIPSAPTGSVAQTFCNSGTVADLIAVGSNIQWYAASTGGTALSAGTALTNGSTYYASQTSGGCESTSRLAVTVTINVPATPTGAAAQTFCNSATVADLTATGTGIQWYATSTGGTALTSGTALATGTTYYASQTINGCESASRFAATVTINTPATPIGAAAETFCNAATVADLTATGTGIQWYAASTGGTALTSGTALITGTTYYATQTVSGCESANRFAVTVTINAPATPTGTVAQTFCNSAAVSDLTAIGSGIQWYTASTGGTALTVGTALTTGTTYYATQTISGCESINRLAVTVTINSPAVPTGATAQTFCNAASVADLTATGSGIQWYAASTGGTVLTSGTALTTGTTYYASQTISGCESANRLAVSVTINAPAAPTGTAAQTFCNSGTVADLTATGFGVQWYSVATGGTALTSGTALTTGTMYYATQTISGCESVNRLEVTATINAPAAPTGASTQTVCSGAIVGDLFVSGSNIQWYAAATGGSPLAPSTALTDGLTYYATQTINGCESLNRFAVNVVFGILSAPTGSAAQTFCNAGTVADLTAVGSNIQWYATSTGGTALSAGTALTNGLAYYASQSSGACESTDRLEITVTINAPAAPTGSAAQEFCNAATVADLAVTGSGIQWYTAATGGSALNSTTPLVNGTYYASQTISGCESASRFAVAVTMNIPAAPAGNANQNFCGSALVSDIAVTGSNITWYDAASAGNVLAPTTALTDGSTYYATQTINGCTSLNQLAVTVSINAIPSAPTGTATQEFCNSATITDLAVTGTTVTWYASAVSTSPLTLGTALNDGASYFATQTVNGCESTDRLEVTVTINVPATPTGNTTQSFCSAAVVDDLSATGTSVAWYTSATGGTPLAGSAALSNGTYYASQTINGCESANRLAVAVTVTILSANVTQSGITLTAAQSGANYTWVDCNNGNQPIAGENGQSFTPTANGSYAVEIDLNGCSVVSSCVQITSVGLEEDKLELINVQPNPTNGILMITVSQPTTAVITASNGTVIATLELEGETTLDATNYAMGVYYIRTAEGQTVKFVKE